MPSSTKNERRTSVRGFGEIAFRVNNLDAMQRFYEQVHRLAADDQSSRLRVFQDCGWLRRSHSGPRLDRSQNAGYRGTDAATSTIDHIAFEIPLADFADERKRLESLGLQVETAEHAWVHWRSLYVSDPEGNQVELVCYDGSV